MQGFAETFREVQRRNYANQRERDLFRRLIDGSYMQTESFNIYRE